MSYIWQHLDWPHFTWDEERVAPSLSRIRRETGYLLGLMDAAGFDISQKTELAALTNTIDNSGKIEGEQLGTEAIRSSVARHIGLDIGGLLPIDRHIDGVVDMMIDATSELSRPLTEERLFGWHAALFPSSWSGIGKIRVGAWRNDADGPMRVISGPMGREKIHYEAPPAAQLPQEIGRFLAWFNADKLSDTGGTDPILVSALAHLWFVTLHPFDDGNGRISRAIAELALARADGVSRRFYSVTTEIRKDRAGYYDILVSTQKSGLDVTEWLLWYLHCIERALAASKEAYRAVRDRAAFWLRANEVQLNERQRRMLRLLLDGFKGKMTTTKWAILCKCSQDSAARDIADLVASGLMEKGPAGGRSTSYLLSSLGGA
ncbi:Fic family protein [Treponema sp.]